LPRKLYEEGSISGDFNVRIYHRDNSAKTFDLWYQGLIEHKSPSLSGNSENISVSGHGYQAQLSRIYITELYTSTEVSVIVKDILDTYITPNTDISYSAADIEVTTFTPDKLDFNTDALSALRTCADIVGGREWGVDKDRNFFFKARSTSIGFRYPLERNVINFNEDLSFEDVVNRIIIQGAEAGGTYYTATYNDAISQLKYNLRTRVIQNSSISTSTVAQQFATAVFAELSGAVRKVNMSLVNLEAYIESTCPIPLFVVIDKSDTYGTKRYGTGLYCGEVSRQVNRINYSVSNQNTLKLSVDLGQPRSSLAEEIAQLEYQLEQQRSAGL
jgi:hypothetical protein